MTPSGATSQINRLLIPLIESGLAIDQTSAFRRTLGDGVVEVTFPNADELRLALGFRSYPQIYETLAGARAYTVLLDDGALVQMQYRFGTKGLLHHRLALLGAPTGEVGTTGGSATVLRFDFDVQEHPGGRVVHPKSHLTIGLCEHCRIPVSSPLTPAQFLRFILRNFYPPDGPSLPSFGAKFAECISQPERQIVHMVVPQDYGMADAA